VFKFQE